MMDIEEIASNFVAKRHADQGKGTAKHRIETLLEINNQYSIGFRESLVSWYVTNRRKMPWRGDDTPIPVSPYGVWISEVMLQQTRVETVIAYWNRWMSKYPTVEALSHATSEEVNSLWSGLGYYRRAQNLLLGAKFIMEKCNGMIPSNKKQLLEVPGIGPYTAGAILSIAYQQNEPLVDGNVHRVFSRLFCLNEELGGTGSPLEKVCWRVAEQLIRDEKQPHYYNQGLMELGATICKPTNPDCANCPVGTFCKGKELIELRASDPKNYSYLPEDVTFFPVKKPKKKQKEIRLLVYVMIHERIQPDGSKMMKYLLLKRPEKGLLANQWEFPNLPIDLTETNEEKEGTIEKEEEENDVDEDKPEPVIDLPQMLQRNHDNMLKYFQQRCSAQVLIPSDSLRKAEDSTSDYIQSSIKYIFESKSSVSIKDPIVHVFSHERHTMHVHMNHVNLIALEEEAILPTDLCWKTYEEMNEMGITTGCKKILEKVEKEVKNRMGQIKEEEETGVSGSTKKRKINLMQSIKNEEKTNNVFALMQKASANIANEGKNKKKTKKS